MRVIAVASQKGGSGKTTLSGHLAVAAERAGAGPVALVDTDPQGSLSHWWNSRQAATPVFARTGIGELALDALGMRELGISLLVIDTPPAIRKTIAEVVRLADLVVIPARPSPHDLRAAGATIELVEQLRKELVFVINGAPARGRLTADAVEVLSRHGSVSPVILHQRAGFAASMIDGRTVMEISGERKAASEVMRLWSDIEARLGSSDPLPLPAPLPALADLRVMS